MMITLPVVYGILATLGMTMLVAFGAILARKPFHVIKNLRVLLFQRFEDTENRSATHFIATLIHYAIGVAFAFGYYLLLKQHVLELDLLHATLFGIAIGLIGIAGWRVALTIQRHLVVPDISQYLSLIFIGHIALAILLYVLVKSFPGGL